MELHIEHLPSFNDLDDGCCEEIELMVRAGKLSPEDAPDYDGWFTVRELGSHALIACVGYERETEGDTNNIYMQSLVVDKAHRKHGVGRMLANRLFEETVGPGETLVALAPFWTNEFFQKLGFYKINAREIKTQDDIAGRNKYKYCTAWVKEKA